MNTLLILALCVAAANAAVVATNPGNVVQTYDDFLYPQVNYGRGYDGNTFGANGRKAVISAPSNVPGVNTARVVSTSNTGGLVGGAAVAGGSYGYGNAMGGGMGGMGGMGGGPMAGGMTGMGMGGGPIVGSYANAQAVRGNQDDCQLNTKYTTTEGVAVLWPAGSNVTGTVAFDQRNGVGPVTVTGTVYGLGANTAYGFHIHEFGNVGNACNDAGDHFNPDGYPHGALSDPIRHAGDLGNIQSDVNGVATFTLQSNAFSLNGDYGVIGRTIVVHSMTDDLGRGTASDSQTTGNSGSRAACGIIGVNSETESNNDIKNRNENNRNQRN